MKSSPQRSDEQDYAVAVHESAHTLALLHYDLNVEYVTIDPDGSTRKLRVNATDSKQIEALLSLLDAIPAEIMRSRFEGPVYQLQRQAAPLLKDLANMFRPEQADKLVEVFHEVQDWSLEGLDVISAAFIRRLLNNIGSVTDLILRRVGHVRGDTRYRTSETKALTAPQRMKAEDIAVTYAAGHAAARSLPGESRYGGYSDDHVIRRIVEDLAQFTDDKLEGAAIDKLLRLRATKLVQYYHEAIDLLATRLIKLRKMSGGEVKRFLDESGMPVSASPRFINRS